MYNFWYKSIYLENAYYEVSKALKKNMWQKCKGRYIMVYFIENVKTVLFKEFSFTRYLITYRLIWYFNISHFRKMCFEWIDILWFSASKLRCKGTSVNSRFQSIGDINGVQILLKGSGIPTRQCSCSMLIVGLVKYEEYHNLCVTAFVSRTSMQKSHAMQEFWNFPLIYYAKSNCIAYSPH